ncbi:MAG: virulence RhuM family protein [Candidatus Solibacter usitatus]|nr:virulence RhuM family protein [Candidatus Solibacter usitatus]
MSDELVPFESEVLLYRTPDGKVRVEVYFRDETFWLTLNRIADLFGTSKQAVSYHLKNIYGSKELSREATVKEILTVQSEGGRTVSRTLDYYNLDVVIAVGYRVNSFQATQFRIWATKTLREFMVKGFVLDDERLKQGKQFGADYFEELLERIREIRASERRFYLKITDIYEQCSTDYDAAAEITKAFFKTVQNKLHWAITGQTAAEIVAERADAAKPNMGLPTWKNAPAGRITKADVTIAKNYLAEKEIKELERIVVMYLDFAELQATRRIGMRMKEWVERLDAFLQFNEYEVLTNPGSVSHEVAKALAEGEYEKFRVMRDREAISDFEREVKRIEAGGGVGERRAGGGRE